MNKGRFESFTDGVFAFAITLLILGIVLPAMSHPSEREVSSAILSLWPNFLAFALSFAVIGIMWQNHHALFRFVARVDRKTVALNLLLLFGTVVIPFATSTTGAYPTMHASTLLYGLVLTWCSTSYNLLLSHLIASGAFDSTVTPERLAQTVVAYRVGWFTYVGATLLALVLPILSFAAYIAITFYYYMPRGVDADIA
ncbi:MAG TPA: TMEM175 family protein [Verrucomicrobiae bacterium]|nr:TMEM175 family protein [Verrucomicrobiae bacterium]